MTPEEIEIIKKRTNKTLENLVTNTGETSPCHVIPTAYHTYGKTQNSLKEMVSKGKHSQSYEDSNGITIVFGVGLILSVKDVEDQNKLVTDDIIVSLKDSIPDDASKDGIIVLTNIHLDDEQVAKISEETGRNVLFAKGTINDPNVETHLTVDAHGNFSLEGPEGVYIGTPNGVIKYGDQLTITAAGNQIVNTQIETAQSIVTEKEQIVAQRTEELEGLEKELDEVTTDLNRDFANFLGREKIKKTFNKELYLFKQAVDTAETNYEYAKKKAEEPLEQKDGEHPDKLRIELEIAKRKLDKAKQNLKELETLPFQNILIRKETVKTEYRSEYNKYHEFLTKSLHILPIEDINTKMLELIKKSIHEMADDLDIKIKSYQYDSDISTEKKAIIAAKNKLDATILSIISLLKNKTPSDRLNKKSKKQINDILVESLENKRHYHNKLYDITSEFSNLDEEIGKINQKIVDTGRLRTQIAQAQYALKQAQEVLAHTEERVEALQQRTMLPAPTKGSKKEPLYKEDIIASLKEKLIQARISLGERLEVFEKEKTVASYRDTKKAKKEVKNLQKKIEIIENAPPFVKDLEAYGAAIAVIEARHEVELTQELLTEINKLPKDQIKELELVTEDLVEAKQNLQQAEDELNRLQGLIPKETPEEKQDTGQEETKQNDATNTQEQDTGQEETKQNTPSQVTPDHLNALAGGATAGTTAAGTTAAGTTAAGTTAAGTTRKNKNIKDKKR